MVLVVLKGLQSFFQSCAFWVQYASIYDHACATSASVKLFVAYCIFCAASRRFCDGSSEELVNNSVSVVRVYACVCLQSLEPQAQAWKEKMYMGKFTG